MPLKKLTLRPGVNREKSERTRPATKAHSLCPKVRETASDATMLAEKTKAKRSFDVK